MKRRSFLQRIGSILAVLGITETEWLTLGDRYYQALAQPNPRKLALLIGINQYPQSPYLSGCLTDVELQTELLMHRFGFLASDILTLTDEQASRESIEAAFLEHLGKQVKSTDVVVFHFSGYGTRIQLETSSDTLQNALVPANGYQSETIVNYVLEETLLLLLRSLPTEHVTAVLDTSYYAPTTAQLAGSRIRARPELPEAQLAAPELDFLQQLKTQKSLSHPIVLSATSNPKQVAREVLFSGFSAGLFTYALTQYFWETTPATTIQVSLDHVRNSMQQLGNKQYPNLANEQKNQQAALTIENLLLDSNIGAEGAIIAIKEEGKANLWLGGLPPKVLEYYGVNSRLKLLTGEELILRSRTGLTAKAQISQIEAANSPQAGQLFQESVRVLPRSINLTVALDTRLERIERVDATSAFAGVGRISVVVAGEQPADYVFGKLPQTSSRYGLFSLGGELIPNTVGEIEEAVKIAVQRLGPKLPTLLAAKLWQLTENQGSSHLQVKATLEIISGISPRIVLQRETVRTLNTGTSLKKSLSSRDDSANRLYSALSTPTVSIGSKMQYRVQNNSDRAVYLMLLGLKNSSTAIAFYPWQTSQDANTATKPLLKQVVIAPGETLILPQNITASEWVISGPAYESEHQLIFSTSPFSETLKALETAKYPAGEQPIGALVNPLEIAQALLQDLHNASTVKAEMNGTAADSYILDVNNWASLSFSYQVG
ncbi:caspase family protein [Nostoc sp. CENA67]|uniref:Caspase family protein n=1 Tax=Amazonocrinis nigriterrae CENA67 TaxID=2794033 RepID=A0A8J7HQ45_9NOST|nr:caspase family protein [Amazonocrinis nigriterrae]MBH8561425.1 caspase family protein [Amazonocrinis nigriterrae CENA67]